MKRIVVLLLCSSALAGCDTVKLQYKDPSTAEVLADADAGYHYFALPRTYILVAPEAGSGQGNAQGSGNKSTGGGAAQGVSGNGNGGLVRNKPHKGTHQGGSSNQQANSNAANGNDAGGSKPSAGSGGTSSGSDSGGSKPQDLAKAQIGSATWNALAIPLPDDKLGLMVRGKSGMWEQTTLNVGRYDNSDMPNTIGSKAENLVPKRIGQFASVLTTVASIAAVAGLPLGAMSVESSSLTPAPTPPPLAGSDLQPFTIAVGDAVASGNPNGDTNWTYKLTFDSDTVPDSLAFQSFKDTVMASQNKGEWVNYWPVPACRGVTITVDGTGSDGKTHNATFHLTVGTPDHVRPEMLPVDGSLELGTVCSGSAKGTMNADPGSDAVADLQALQDAVNKLKSAGKSSGAKPGGS